MKSAIIHLKKYLFRGMISVIPVALTYFVLRILYLGIDQNMADILDDIIGFRIPGLGILLIVIVLYFAGLVASNVVGSRFLNFIERVTSKIPLIRTTYQVGSQLSTMLSLPERQVFKKVVLVEYLNPGTWTIGFVTGSIMDKKNNDDVYLKVFIPTPPLPTSGTMLLVLESKTRDPGWTIEEAMKTVISGGIIGPTKFE